MKTLAQCKSIIESLNTAILLVDEDFSIIYLNPAAQALLNVSSNSVHGRQLHNVLANTTELEHAISRSVIERSVFSEREISIFVPTSRTRIKVDCTFTPYALESGLAAVLIELRPMDRLLRIAREENRLAQQNAVKTLVRGLAHEVKNPLGGLRGAAQLLERELHSEELKEFTQIIIGEADRLQHLVDDMLGPNQLLRKSPISIHQVLEHVRQLIVAEGKEGIEITRDYDPSLPDIIVDQDRLIQATLNIVRNATEAIASSGRIVLKTRMLRQFTLGHKHHRLVLKVQIIDNGPGIAKELIDHIFYPMVTGRSNGSGLGLSITQTIVSQHEGLVECTSEPGNTVFTILLPYLNQDVNKPSTHITHKKR